MKNTAENDFFGLPKVKWLHLTGEVDKHVTFSCQIFSGFNVLKSLKSVNFWQSYSKKVDVFFRTRYHRLVNIFSKCKSTLKTLCNTRFTMSPPHLLLHRGTPTLVSTVHCHTPGWMGVHITSHNPNRWAGTIQIPHGRYGEASSVLTSHSDDKRVGRCKVIDNFFSRSDVDSAFSVYGSW